MPDFDQIGGPNGDAGPLFRAQKALSDKWPKLFDYLTRRQTPAGTKRFPSELRVTGGREGLLVEFFDHQSEMSGYIPVQGLETLLDDVEKALNGSVPVGWKDADSWLQARERKKRRASGLDKPVEKDKSAG